MTPQSNGKASGASAPLAGAANVFQDSAAFADVLDELTRGATEVTESLLENLDGLIARREPGVLRLQVIRARLGRLPKVAGEL